MAIQLKALFLALYSLLNTYIFIAGSLNKRLKVNNFCALVYAHTFNKSHEISNERFRWKETKSHLSSSLKFQFTGTSAAQGQRVENCMVGVGS